MSSGFLRWVVLCLLGGPVWAGTDLSPEQVRALPPAAAGPVQFGRDIQPILETACVKCHGRGKAKGKFSLETRERLLAGGDSGPAVVVGTSESSLLIALGAGVDPENVMTLNVSSGLSRSMA